MRRSDEVCLPSDVLTYEHDITRLTAVGNVYNKLPSKRSYSAYQSRNVVSLYLTRRPLMRGV